MTDLDRFMAVQGATDSAASQNARGMSGLQQPSSQVRPPAPITGPQPMMSTTQNLMDRPQMADQALAQENKQKLLMMLLQMVLGGGAGGMNGAQQPAPSMGMGAPMGQMGMTDPMQGF